MADRMWGVCRVRICQRNLTHGLSSHTHTHLSHTYTPLPHTYAGQGLTGTKSCVSAKCACVLIFQFCIIIIIIISSISSSSSKSIVSKLKMFINRFIKLYTIPKTLRNNIYIRLHTHIHTLTNARTQPRILSPTHTHTPRKKCASAGAGRRSLSPY